MTAKEFEQGIKTGLNKLSKQEGKQIRDEFNSEPDYPIPSQNLKNNRLKNDRGVYFSFKNSKFLRLQN